MPKLHEVQLHRLHPTQMTVGMIEVQDKRDHLKSLGRHEQRELLAAHPIPGVWGPEDKLYLIDHHHLARAAQESGIDTGFFQVEENLSSLEIEPFWHRMISAHWAHPIDEHGQPKSWQDIPKHVQKLRDDVYRSLAAYVRNAGGYNKTATAFAEFLWADFFRSRITIGPDRSDFDRAVRQALQLARSGAAAGLPGFIG